MKCVFPGVNTLLDAMKCRWPSSTLFGHVCVGTKIGNLPCVRCVRVLRTPTREEAGQPSLTHSSLDHIIISLHETYITLFVTRIYRDAIRRTFCWQNKFCGGGRKFLMVRFLAPGDNWIVVGWVAMMTMNFARIYVRNLADCGVKKLLRNHFNAKNSWFVFMWLEMPAWKMKQLQ